MPWTVIANPAAGRGRARRLLPDLARAVEAAGVEVGLQVSRDGDDARRLAEDAATAGRDLVACGGDGLVGMLAGIAAAQDRRLAVVPAGAGNDFARTLGYDCRNPLSALGVLRDGTDRTIDLGRVNGRAYGCVTCTGFDAEANRWANTVRRLSGTALYLAAVARTLVVYRPLPFRLTVDEEAHEVTAWLVAVANGPAYGGGMRIAPEARLDDGLLDVTVVGRLSRIDFAWSFPRVFKGTHLSHPRVSSYRGRVVRLESLDPSVPLEVYADGERVGPLPATMEAWPAALTVRVPGRGRGDRTRG